MKRGWWWIATLTTCWVNSWMMKLHLMQSCSPAQKNDVINMNDTEIWLREWTFEQVLKNRLQCESGTRTEYVGSVLGTSRSGAPLKLLLTTKVVKMTQKHAVTQFKGSKSLTNTVFWEVNCSNFWTSQYRPFHIWLVFLNWTFQRRLHQEDEVFFLCQKQW